MFFRLGIPLPQYANVAYTNHTAPERVIMQIGLKYLATGDSYHSNGRLHGVANSTVSLSVSRVNAYLCSLAPEIIHMPTR